MARVLVLREEAEAARTAALLSARGHDPILLPLQDVRALDPASPPGPFAGFLVTSGHALDWLLRHHRGSPSPVLAVGYRTAERLRNAGFPCVLSGGGRAENLADLAASVPNPACLPFLYAAGRVRMPGLEAALGEKDLPFQVVDVYDMVDRAITMPDVRHALGGAVPEAVLVLSRRQAELFCDLADEMPALIPPAITHLCLSQAIAARLSPGRRPHATVALRPDIAALLDLLV